MSPRGVERAPARRPGGFQPAGRGLRSRSVEIARTSAANVEGPGTAPRVLEDLVVVGVAVPDAPQALRLRVARALHASGDESGGVAGGAAVLATCARAEIYAFDPTLDDRAWRRRFASAVGGLAPEDLAAVRVRRGVDAVRHLFRVASGLVSRVVGEHEVLGQVRAVHAQLDRSLRGEARETGAGRATLRPLRHLFAAAVAAGRCARAESGLDALAASYAGLAVEALGARLGDLGAAHIGILGSGALGQSAARALQAAGAGEVTVFARHPERLRAPIEDPSSRPVRAAPADTLESLLPDLDALVTAVRTRESLLRVSHLAGRRPGLVVVDFGMPPNVECDVVRPAIELVTLDGLASAPARNAIAAAEGVVERETARFVRWIGGRVVEIRGRSLGDRPARLGATSSRSARAQPSAVLLAAHGAGEGSAANDGVAELARLLARRLPGTVVGVGFVLGAPTWAEAAARLRGASQAWKRDLTVVPVLTSTGYFTERRLPAAVEGGGAGTRIAAPLGTHPRITRALVARTIERLRELSVGEAVDCLVVGHGTSRAAGSGDATLALVRTLELAVAAAALRVGVSAAFLDQPPRLEESARRSSARRLLVVPFLLGGGPHLRHDLAARLTQATSASLSIEPGLLEDRAFTGALIAALVDRATAAGPSRFARAERSPTTIAGRRVV